MSKKIALFHPWIKSRGGAERVVLEILKKSEHEIDVYTWVYEEDKTFPEFKDYSIKVIAPSSARWLSRLNVLRGLFLPLGVLKKIPVERYDLLLISTSGMGEFVTFRSSRKGDTIAYVHTPLRESDAKIRKWNLVNRYKNKFFNKVFYLAAAKIYTGLEKIAWKKLDVVIFNSELSKSRAEERGLMEGKKSYIVNPPIDVSKFRRIKPANSKKKYFLYVSRLNPPKRQDVLINAWKNFVEKFPLYHLIIAGTPENKKYFEDLERLKKETKNIEIKTDVSDKEIFELVSGCVAGIFLGYQEDFGISPIEVLSANKPLIAVEEGGYMDLIRDHPNFHKIREKHNNEEMVKEVETMLEKFVKSKQKIKKSKIKIKDFISEIDKILEDGRRN